MHLGRVLGLALPLMSLTTSSAEAGQAPEATATAADAPDLDDQAAKEAAKKLVSEANVAFKAGDYMGAIGLYKLAMARRPAPKLHYNIAVCHERLIAEAATSEDRTRHADLAIEAYNNYLVENPRAGDRMEVADRVRALGGAPANDTGLMDVEFGGTTDPADASDPVVNDESEPDGEVAPDDPNDADPLPVDSGVPPDPPTHGRFSLHLNGGWMPQYLSSEVEGATIGALSGNFGLYAGKRRHLLIGIAFSVFSGGATNQEKYALVGAHVGPILDLTRAFGDAKRIELGMGLIPAYTYQAVHTRGADADHPNCSLEINTRVGARHGFLGAGRLSFAVLLGKRRASAIDLRVQPGVAVFGPGKTAAGCAGGETTISARGLDDRAVFQLLTGLGYSMRF